MTTNHRIARLIVAAVVCAACSDSGDPRDFQATVDAPAVTCNHATNTGELEPGAVISPTSAWFKRDTPFAGVAVLVLENIDSQCGTMEPRGHNIAFALPCNTIEATQYSVEPDALDCSGAGSSDIGVVSEGYSDPREYRGTFGSLTVLDATEDCVRGTYEVAFGTTGTLAGDFAAVRCDN